jgi:predicted TIM-barrel fold metal-dependent hydrolase
MTYHSIIDSMDDLGIDGALATSVLLYDGIEYIAQAYREYPGRFKLVAQIDLDRPDYIEQLEKYRTYLGFVAARLNFPLGRVDHLEVLRSGGLASTLKRAESCGLPMMFAIMGQAGELAAVAQAYPRLRIIVDHLGVPAAGLSREIGGDPGDQPFTSMSQVIELARYDNVYVKVSGAPTASLEPYPFPDLWPHIRLLMNAFGVERLMWGSNFSRTLPDVTYEQGINYLRDSGQLSREEKEWLLGRTATSVFGWGGS